MNVSKFYIPYFSTSYIHAKVAQLMGQEHKRASQKITLYLCSLVSIIQCLPPFLYGVLKKQYNGHMVPRVSTIPWFQSFYNTVMATWFHSLKNTMVTSVPRLVLLFIKPIQVLSMSTFIHSNIPILSYSLYTPIELCEWRRDFYSTKVKTH